jgi:hypothetical protein
VVRVSSWAGLAIVACAASAWIASAPPARAIQAPPLPSRSVPVAGANDLAYSTTDGALYVSVRSTIDPAQKPTPTPAPLANSVVPVDPRTLEIGTPIPVGPDPDQLAISDDGRYLYVTVDRNQTVQRIDLATRTIDLQFPVGTAPGPGSGVRLGASDIEVVPGNARAVAIARVYVNQPYGVALYDDGIQRPATASAAGRIVFAPGQPDRIYGYDNAGSAHGAYRLDVGPTGVTVGMHRADVLDGFVLDIAYDEGRLFDGTNLVNAETLQHIGSVEEGMAAPSNVVPFADIANNQLFRLQPCASLTVYAADSLSEVAQFGVHCDDVSSAPKSPLVEAGGQVAFVSLSTVELFRIEAAGGSAGEYTALTPVRVLDTRTAVGTGGLVGPVGPAGQLDVQITGRGGIPADGVDAVVLNATVTAPTAASYLTVWPTGVARPEISNLNYVAGTTRANLVTTALGAGGQVSLFNEQGSADVLFDVVGYYAKATGTAGSRFRPLEPNRAFDTRSGIGGVPASPVGPGSTLRFDVTGSAGVPADAVTAVAMNVTAVSPTADTYLTVWPDDVAQPYASNLNAAAGDTVPNLVIMRVPTSGVVDFFNFAGATHLIADVVGYYTSDAQGDAGRFVAFTPFRLLDTRLGYGGGPGLIGPGQRIEVRDDRELYAAYALNVTATGTVGAGYVTVHPLSAFPPATSNLNYGDGQTVPNAVLVRTQHGFQLSNDNGSAYLIADVFGAFTGG